MATPLSSLKAFAALCRSPYSDTDRVSGGNLRPPSLILPRRRLPSSVVAFSRRRTNNSANSPSSSRKKKRSSSGRNSREEEGDIDEDAFEKLFSMLAEDLKNDEASISDDVDEDISEEDFEKLQRELEEVLGIGDDDDVDLTNLTGDDVEDPVDIIEDDEEEEEDEEEEQRPVKLKNWQFRRLARALKNGRRKTSIKNLAAELCLDRAIVLDLLRDPPPNLVMMSATLPDEPAPIPVMPQTNPIEIDSIDEPIVYDAKPKSEKEVPVHVMRHSWNAQKRLKKVHIDTLERVYKRSKRPTNAMISSIVQVTNLPRKRVVKWFEDKRNEDGVPGQHAPFQRSVSEAISS